MEKLSGLVLQLKVKTGFVVSDDLDEVVDDMLKKIVEDNQDNIDDIRETIPPEQRVGLYNTKIAKFNQIQDINEKFLSFTALLDHAQLYFKPVGKLTLDSYEFYKKIDKALENIRREYKSNLNTNKIMSTTAFEKLNTISDTIPNIINQILSLALGISKIVVTKITEWSTEITNEDLSKVIDTSNELIEDVALINSKAGIQPYITIYKKLKKPIEDINKSVNEMGKLAGVISYDDNVKNQFKYTNTIGYVNRAATQTNEPEVDYSKILPPLPIVPPAQSTGASGVGETKGAGKFMHSYHAKRFL
jgi:gas vesicle protein